MMDFSKYGKGGDPAQTPGASAPAGKGMGLMQGAREAMQGMAKAPGMSNKFGEMFNKSPFSKQSMDNWADKLADRRAQMEKRIQARRAEMAAKRQAFQEKMQANPGMAPWGRSGN
jgi:hypothetical protein